MLFEDASTISYINESEALKNSIWVCHSQNMPLLHSFQVAGSCAEINMKIKMYSNWDKVHWTYPRTNKAQVKGRKGKKGKKKSEYYLMVPVCVFAMIIHGKPNELFTNITKNPYYCFFTGGYWRQWNSQHQNISLSDIYYTDIGIFISITNSSACIRDRSHECEHRPVCYKIFL